MEKITVPKSSTKAARDRVISKFPPKSFSDSSLPLVLRAPEELFEALLEISNVKAWPYNENSTPFSELDFHQSVRTACNSNKTGTVGLKVSKAIIVGDVAVGKTCLVQRFCHKLFDRDYKATIGVDFEVERFDILNVPFNLQIWDTAGQERFKCIAAAYYRGAHVVIIVFDLTDGFSLQHCLKWYEDALTDNKENTHVFLVGSKKDECSDVQFQAVEKEAINLAKKIDAEYWSVSSLTGENVDGFFCRVAAITFNAAVQREVEDMEKNSRKKMISVGESSLIKLQPGDLDGSLEDKKFKPKCCN